MNIAVCDDLKEERLKLIKNAEKFFSQKNIAVRFYEFDCGEDLCAADAVVLLSLDLIFLDIYMKQLTGLKTAQTLRNNGVAVPIAFLTSSRDFAVESYDVAALAYLVKPLEKKKFETAMERFLITYRPKSIFIDGRLFVEDDIVFAESEGRTVTFHFKDGSKAKINAKLDSVEDQLSQRQFMRCHQSYIVNFNFITQIKDDTFLTALDLPVMIRKRDFPAIRRTYFHYITKSGGPL